MIPLSPPNQLTLLRVLLTPVFVFLLFSESPANKAIALAVFIIAAVTDWYDGYVARRWGYITRWGKFFDPLADKVLTSAAFISFIYLGYADAWMVWVIVFRDVVITALRSVAELKNTPIDTSAFAKTKTVIQLVTIYFILSDYVVQTVPPFTEIASRFFSTFLTSSVIEFLMLTTTTLTAVTGYTYIQKNFSIIRSFFHPHGSNDSV